MLYTIKVTLDTKENLDKLKMKFSYKSYEDFLKSVYLFFENNSIDLTKPFSNDKNVSLENKLDYIVKLLKEENENLLKFFDTRDQSLRKFVGAMEKSYFKPLLSNVAIKNTIEENNLTPPNTPQSVLKGSPMVTEKNTTDSQEVKQLNNRINSLNKAYDEINNLYDIYKEKLSYLINNVKITSSMTEKDYVEINMSKEDWFEFKKSIPNL